MQLKYGKSLGDGCAGECECLKKKSQKSKFLEWSEHDQNLKGEILGKVGITPLMLKRLLEPEEVDKIILFTITTYIVDTRFYLRINSSDWCDDLIQRFEKLDSKKAGEPIYMYDSALTKRASDNDKTLLWFLQYFGSPWESNLNINVNWHIVGDNNNF